MTDAGADQELDARGLTCPEPLMLVRNRVREMQSGHTLRVLATDPSTVRDLQQFCRFMSHEMLSHEQNGDELQFLIRKGS